MAKKRKRRHARGPGIVATLRDPKKLKVAYIVAGFALVFGGSLGFGASRCDSNRPGSGTQTSNQPSDVIASIEDHEITYYEYSRDFEAARKRLDASEEQSILNPPEYWARKGYEVLRQMIDLEYFDIRAKQEGIEISEEDIDARMAQYRQMLVPPTVPDQDRSLLQRLSEVVQTVKEDKVFSDRLQQLDPTLTIGRLREIVQQEMLAQQYVARLQTEYQQEVITELSGEANTVRDEIIDGLDFAEAARTYSEHEASSTAGGLIPMVKHSRTDLPSQVITSAFSLPVDEISLPIVVTNPEFIGVWLLKVISRKEASGDDWLAAREEIGARLLEERRQQVEQGIIQMPEDGNLTVSEEEKINEYEEADIRIIYFKAEDPMGRVQQFVLDDEATMTIVINDPSLRSWQFMIDQEWEPAAISYYDALQRNSERYDPELDNQYAIEMQEANLRYLLGYFWSNRAFTEESKWFQGIWEIYQTNPDAFGEDFPEPPENIVADQQGYFVLAMANYNRAIELEDLDPWSHLARAQIDTSRKLISTRAIDDIKTAFEFSSGDIQLEQRVYGITQQLISLDDIALEAAGDVRPEVWEDPVFPESEHGIILDSIDSRFYSLLDATDFIELQNPDAQAQPALTEPVETSPIEPINDVDESVSETDVDESDMISEETIEIIPADEPAEIPDNDNETDIPDWLPMVPVPEPNGPLTQELRDDLDSFFEAVQASVDELMAQQQAQQQQQQALQQQQFEQLPVNPPAGEGEPTSENGDNLLNPEVETIPSEL